MSAFHCTTLWSKSVFFVTKALEARDRREELEFHLWVAIALELLGKSALASIHPALVADPRQFNSLLSACGRDIAVNVKSITAKTVYERLETLGAIDRKLKGFCQAMANRRNEELHSGTSPVSGLDHRQWVTTFWKVSDKIIQFQERQLEDWIGDQEGERVAKILADASELLRQTVLARIDRLRADYNSRYPPASIERDQAKTRSEWREPPYVTGDAWEAVNCPSCDSRAWLFGTRAHEEEVDFEVVVDDHEYGFQHYLQTIEVSYAVDEFLCFECDLNLEGVEEVEVAELPTHFERIEELEPDYEPDYGNE